MKLRKVTPLPPAPVSPPDLVVTMTREQLREEIRLAVAEALDAQQPADVLDQEGMGALLGISSKTLARMCEEQGLPHFYAGNHRRFRRSVVLAWIEEAERANPPTPRVRLATGGQP